MSDECHVEKKDMVLIMAALAEILALHRMSGHGFGATAGIVEDRLRERVEELRAEDR